MSTPYKGTTSPIPIEPIIIIIIIFIFTGTAKIVNIRDANSDLY